MGVYYPTTATVVNFDKIHKVEIYTSSVVFSNHIYQFSKRKDMNDDHKQVIFATVFIANRPTSVKEPCRAASQGLAVGPSGTVSHAADENGAKCSTCYIQLAL